MDKDIRTASCSHENDDSKSPCGVTRREALILAAGVSVLSLLPIFKASADTPDQWIVAGKKTDFVAGTPARVVLPTPAPPAGAPPASPEVIFITKVDEKSILAVSAKCTHRGCEVAWKAADNQFECPCHGGAFAASGKNNHGTSRDPGTPLPPLLSLPTRINGANVEVNLAGIAPDSLEPKERRPGGFGGPPPG